ncbi:hypothetical protein HPB49_015326 [Dermacentor silvarum]|uniref:Uncharacterized protein n=1 Tax=Dermacentor silvarum TaxID=543639 RepID=A0ACB8CFV8_DERSI|nr:hypothetical protein HPB49_015326 [Dermacentor silvarum]
MVITGTKLLYDRYSVIVEPMVADASEKIVKVLLTNCSPQAIVLPSQMTVGVVEEAGGIEDIELSVEDCQQILQVSCLPSPEDLDEPPAYAAVDPQHCSIQIGDPSVLTPLKKATPADEAKPSDGEKDPWDDTAEPNSSVEIEDKDAKETCTLAEATTGETQDTYDTVMPASCSAPAKRLHEETDEQEEKDQEKGCSDEPPPKAPPGRRPAFKPKPGVQAKRRTTTPTPPR